MDEDLLPSECEQPRYLLPEGCMDLNDVIALQERDAVIQKQVTAISELLKKHASTPFLGYPACITIPDPVSVSDLAGMLSLKPYQVIALLMKFDIFASATSEVAFETAVKACALLRVEVKKADDS